MKFPLCLRSERDWLADQNSRLLANRIELKRQIEALEQVVADQKRQLALADVALDRRRAEIASHRRELKSLRDAVGLSCSLLDIEVA